MRSRQSAEACGLTSLGFLGLGCVTVPRRALPMEWSWVAPSSSRGTHPQPPEAGLERVLCFASSTSPCCASANKRSNVGGGQKDIRVMHHNSSDVLAGVLALHRQSRPPATQPSAFMSGPSAVPVVLVSPFQSGRPQSSCQSRRCASIPANMFCCPTVPARSRIVRRASQSQRAVGIARGVPQNRPKLFSRAAGPCRRRAVLVSLGRVARQVLCASRQGRCPVSPPESSAKLFSLPCRPSWGRC